MAQTANININVNSKQAQDNVNQLSNSIGNATKSSVNLQAIPAMNDSIISSLFFSKDFSPK
jgi:hypothetical protein